MKKVMKKFNRALSIMLVAAMVLTMAPQTAMPVLAAPDDAVETTVTPDEPAENGEAVVGETVEAPEIGQSEDSDSDTITPDIEQEAEPGDDMQAEAPVVDEEEPAEAVEAEDAANDPMSAEPYALTAADVLAPTGDGFTYTAGENTDVAANGFTFTVTAKPNYTVDSVKYQVGDGTATAADTGANNTYTIPASVFTNESVAAGTKVQILVEATRTQYTVTEAVTVTKTPADTEANVADSEIVDFSWTAATEGADEGSIYAGDTLTFTAKLKTGKEAEYSIAVSYKVGGAEAVTPEIAKNGAYTIANVDGVVVINVTVAPLKQCGITFAENAGIQKIEYLKGTDYVEYDGQNKPTITENQEFKFKVTPKKYFKVDKVTVGEAEVKVDSKGVYTSKITDDTTITVTTSIDAKQCNALTFAVDKNSDLKSAKATITSISANDIDNDIDSQVGDVIDAGETVTIPGDTVTLKIEPSADYTITKVNGSSVTPNADGAVEFKVNRFTNKKATVTVTTDTVGSVSENTLVTFENKAANLSYTVTGDTNIKPVTGEANKYATKTGAKRLKFTITAKGSYKPIVTQAISETEGGELGVGVPVEASKTTLTATGGTYDYIIPISRLGYGAKFTITQDEDTRTVTLSGEGFENVSVVASINGVKRNPDSGSEDKKYTVLLNDVVTLQIKAGTNSDLTKVVSKIGSGKETSAKITNNTATVEVKVTDDTTIDITTKDQYVASVLKQVKDTTETPLTPVDAAKNSYKTAYDGTYKASVVKGASEESVTLSDVKVLLNRNPVAAKAEGTPVAFVTGTEATINLNNAVTTAIAGKTLAVELYAKEGTEDVKVAAYSLIVSVPAKDIKINKSANLTVTQAIDTTKDYTVTAAAGVDLSTLVATKEDAGNIISDMNYANGKLTVVTAAKAPADAKATITVATTATPAEGDPKATIVITPVKLIADNAKAPTVTLLAATDISFKLTLSATTGQAVSENLYYKVVTTESLSGNDIDRVTYVKKTGDSQNASVYVSNNTTLGTGGEGSYKVTASVVHASEEVVGNTLAEEKVLGTSKPSTAKTFKTQKPAYEDKLKLKKGKTTVVTGEKDVVVAEPQFNKYTTYAAITSAEDISSYDAAYKLGVAIEQDPLGNYKIKASAAQNTAIGKHKIQVTASAEGGAYASVATIDVTVVRGIHNLSVNVPSTNLYKAAKKAAKVKATAVYNNGYTGTWVPKNKKVTWDIVDKDENELAANDPLKTMVTVKNGTVTVDKNFIIDPDTAAQHQFKIKVTADNTKSFAGENADGTPIVGYSDVITISNTGEDIKTLAIVKGSEWNQTTGNYNKYTVTVLPTGTKDPRVVPATDVNAGKVVAFTSAASDLAKDKVYTAEEMAACSIDPSNLTLKSSNQKGVPVKADGSLGQVSKLGKVKLTATANDGSKNKAELSLNITNDTTTEELSLKITPASYGNDGWPIINTTADAIYNPGTPGEKVISNLTYDASTTPLIAVQIQQKQENGTAYIDAPMFVNAQLSVSGGGKIVDKHQNRTAFIAITAPEVTVTLKDVTKNETKQFVLKNGGAQGKPTFTAKNKLRSMATVAEQTAAIEVTNLNLPEGTPTTDLVAKVEVDWSAKNQKNQYDLTTFAGYLKDKYNVTIADDKGSFTLNFNGVGENSDENLKWVLLNQKSYKVTVTLGTMNTDGTTFTAKTLPTSMTLNVEKAKKFTFKPTTSYTLTTRDAKASAVLAGKANVVLDDYEVVWSNLQNMNTKGVTNKFTDYFQISDDGKIELRGNEIPAKADLSGYITYHAYSTKSYYSDSDITNTVKITIKVDDKKTVAKYAQKNETVTIGKTAGQKAIVNITSKTGKAAAVAADMAAVVVDPEDRNSTGFLAEKTAGDGAVQLTWNGETELKKNNKYTVKLKIVPATSHYKDALTGLSGDTLNEKIAQYGVAVSVKVKASDPVTPMGAAKTKLTNWLNGLGESDTWLKNGLTATDFVAKAQAAMGADATVAVAQKGEEGSKTNDFTLTDATLTADGSITGNLELTIDGETEAGTVPVNVKIPAGAITVAEAVTAINAATAVTGYAVEVDSVDTANADTVSGAICAKAQDVIGTKYYTVTVKTALTGSKPEAGASGTYTLVLTVKEKDADASATGTDITLTYNVTAPNEGA